MTQRPEQYHRTWLCLDGPADGYKIIAGLSKQTGGLDLDFNCYGGVSVNVADEGLAIPEFLTKLLQAVGEVYVAWLVAHPEVREEAIAMVPDVARMAHMDTLSEAEVALMAEGAARFHAKPFTAEELAANPSEDGA